MPRPSRATIPAPELARCGRGSGHTALHLAALLVCFAVSAPALATLPRSPQHLEYRIAWNGIPAAGAKVAIRPGDRAGADTIVVEATARTNRFVDLFWPFRGTARATFLADSFTPVQFVYDRQMNGTPYWTGIDFAPQRAKSVYIRGSRRRELELAGADTVDPITAVFRACMSGAQAGDVLRSDVWTGESRYRVELSITGPEEITVPAGRFRALRVVPTVWKVGAEPERDTRLRQAAIWVTDDPTHTLLRIRSEVFIGAVTLDLVDAESA